MFKEKTGLNDVDIISKDLNQVKPFKYCRSIVNGDNFIEVEVKEITAPDN
jgi:hypothetical protein